MLWRSLRTVRNPPPREGRSPVTHNGLAKRETHLLRDPAVRAVSEARVASERARLAALGLAK